MSKPLSSLACQEHQRVTNDPLPAAHQSLHTACQANLAPAAVTVDTALEVQKSEFVPPRKKAGGDRSERVQKTLYLPPKLAKKVVVQAAAREIEQSELVTEALQLYFSRPPKPKA